MQGDLPTVPFIAFLVTVPAFITVSVFRDDLSDTMFVLLVAAFLAVAIGLVESDTVFAWGAFAFALVTIVAGWQVHRHRRASKEQGIQVEERPDRSGQ